ncbi:MAG: CBS domain-containing protein [Haloarculaceae archaeon]
MESDVLDRPVRDAMTAPVRTVEYDIAVADAARILLRNRIGALVVIDDGIAGILTETDVVESVAAEHDIRRLTVGQLMTSEVVTVDADATVETACERMRSRDVKKLPVTEDGDLVGILTTTDVAHALVPDLDDIVLSYQ